MSHNVKLGGEKDVEAGFSTLIWVCDVTAPCESEWLTEVSIFRLSG